MAKWHYSAASSLEWGKRTDKNETGALVKKSIVIPEKKEDLKAPEPPIAAPEPASEREERTLILSESEQDKHGLSPPDEHSVYTYP